MKYVVYCFICAVLTALALGHALFVETSSVAKVVQFAYGSVTAVFAVLCVAVLVSEKDEGGE